MAPLVNTVDAGYKTLARFTESFVFYSIEFFPDIRTFLAGYKNIPDIRTSYWKTVTIYHIYVMGNMRNWAFRKMFPIWTSPVQTAAPLIQIQSIIHMECGNKSI